MCVLIQWNFVNADTLVPSVCLDWWTKQWWIVGIQINEVPLYTIYNDIQLIISEVVIKKVIKKPVQTVF